MTTIAANRRSIACDRQATVEDERKFLFDEKVFKLTPKQTERLVDEKCYSFCGFAGNIAAGHEARTWLEDTEQHLPKFKDTEFLLVTSSGNIYWSENFEQWDFVEEDFYSIGTGKNFATGALTAGKTPKQAVLIAAQHDLRSGMGVLEYKFRKKKKGAA